MDAITLGIVYNYKGRLSKDGKAEVSIRAYQGGKRLYISTGVKVPPDSWDKKRLRVKMSVPNAIEINKVISTKLEQLERYIFEQKTRGRLATLESLKEQANPKERSTDFIQYFDKSIRRNKTIKDSSKKSYISSLRHLKAFRKYIDFEELTPRLLREFEDYLRERVGVNTTGRYLKQVRAIINQGIRDEEIPSNIEPFRHFKIKSEPTKPKFITTEDIDKLERIDLSEESEGIQYVRDMYLFAVYTGLRISDTKRVTPRNIEEADGQKWLRLDKMQKTGEPVNIPIDAIFCGSPLKLLDKYYRGLDIPYFGRYTDQYVNRKLKVLGAMAGIKKPITFHTARHTNATHLLNKGVALGVVQKVLGHTKQSTTEIYAKTLQKTIREEIRKAFES